MAFLRPIERTCPCGGRAKFEVVNSQNRTIGTFCKACAKRELRAVVLAEKGVPA